MVTRIILSGWTVALLTVLVGLMAPPAVAGGDAQVVPSERCRGLWLVPIEYRAGDDGSLLMVLDTGAGTTSVDPGSIERVFGRRVRTGKRITLKDGTAGPLEIGRLKVVVHDMDHLSRSLGREIDGILGFDVFRSFLLTLDYPADEVRVGRGALPEEDGRVIVRDHGKGRPYLAIEVGGKKLAVLVDSGAVGAFRFKPGDPLAWRVEPRAISASTGYDEIRLNRAGRAAVDLVVGPLVATVPIVRVHEGTRLIGAEILQRFAWTFDQRARRIRLLPDSPEPIVAGPERGIGVAFRPVAEGFEVARIFEDFPAARTGLAEGDLVLAIDGVAVTDRGCTPAVDPAGRASVVLTVRRNGGLQDVDIPIVDLVP